VLADGIVLHGCAEVLIVRKLAHNQLPGPRSNDQLLDLDKPMEQKVQGRYLFRDIAVWSLN
jgi:hypothetical protein